MLVSISNKHDSKVWQQAACVLAWNALVLCSRQQLGAPVLASPHRALARQSSCSRRCQSLGTSSQPSQGFLAVLAQTMAPQIVGLTIQDLQSGRTRQHPGRQRSKPVCMWHAGGAMCGQPDDQVSDDKTKCQLRHSRSVSSSCSPVPVVHGMPVALKPVRTWRACAEVCSHMRSQVGGSGQGQPHHGRSVSRSRC